MTPDTAHRLARLGELITRQRQQLLVLLCLSLAIVACAIAAYLIDPLAFRRFFGRWNPVVVVVFVVLLGGGLLWCLVARGWFVICKAGNPARFLVYSGLAILLAAVMILVDRQGIFGKDINVPFPQSLVFYPTMGYVADIVFNILPLTLLLVALTALFGEVTFSKALWPCIVIVSLLEPIFQVAPNVGEYPHWASAYVAMHIMAINVIQLALFKRYDFITMYAFRIAYYAVWHIAWGYVRLDLLF